MPKKDELTDFYKKMPKEFKPKYRNPNYKKHLLNVPFRGLIVGGSGSGKTTLVLEIIQRMSKTFEKIILCCKQPDEPLYKLLQSKLHKDQIDVYEGGDIPSLEQYADFDGQILMIFDDLMNEKDQSDVVEWFIRGRKIAGGVSMIYLTQSYYRCPKTVRLQCNYILLKKLTSMKDLQNILEDFNLGVDKIKLLSIYKDATKERRDFLTIDVDEVPEKRFRENFLNIITM
jgi:hypothetical protein